MRKLSIQEIQSQQLQLMQIVDEVCCKNNIVYYLISGSCLGAVRHQGFIPWDDDIDIAMMRDDYEHFLSLFDSYFDTQKYFLQNYETDKDFFPALSRICIRGTRLDSKWNSHLQVCKNAFMDVFPLDRVPDEPVLRRKQYKQLKRIDRLLSLKLYSLSTNKFKNVVKYLISKVLLAVPLKCLQGKRVKVMKRYNGVDTICVASMASKYGYFKQVMPIEFYGKPRKMCFEDKEFYFPEQVVSYLTHLFGKNYMDIPPIEKREVPTDVYLLD